MAAEAVVRVADKELRVDLCTEPGAYQPWTPPGDDINGGPLRPPSRELQRMVIADNAPNLAQVGNSSLVIP